ncbi:MAG: PhzF family phenazine biosynthesis protein [Streptosporangiaceae bacterium]
MHRPFQQVDVFGSEPLGGNPVAVVLDARDLDIAAMQRFARWTKLSETTFLLPPSTPDADYRVRIFTPTTELPFAGHPTLGTCHAWLTSGEVPSRPGTVVQECGAGLVRVRETDSGLAFAAPPLVRSGPVPETVLADIAAQLGIGRDQIADAQWADNGPGWIAVMLSDADQVLSLRPPAVRSYLGVAGPYPPGSECSFEVRAFFMQDDLAVEDPVTGSLNASLAQWLFESGRVTGSYLVSQGTVLGRRGRVRLSRDDDGTVWVAGATVTQIRGEVDL